jgi:hypothetical protein
MYLDKWLLKLNCDELDPDQVSYIKALPDKIPSVSWVWSEMDIVWNDCGINNKVPIKNQNIGTFYPHPVWIMNGLFTEVDIASKKHRESGVLAKTLIEQDLRLDIDIVEPFAFELFKGRTKSFTSVSYAADFMNEYDAALAQDVLEYVDDPIKTAYRICNSVKGNGIVIFASCFYPCIKYHLPSTFYLRHTFKWVMRTMGLESLGYVPSGKHSLVFKKSEALNLNKAQSFASKMRIILPLLNLIVPLLAKVKRAFK